MRVHTRFLALGAPIVFDEPVGQMEALSTVPEQRVVEVLFFYLLMRPHYLRGEPIFLATFLGQLREHLCLVASRLRLQDHFF